MHRSYHDILLRIGNGISPLWWDEHGAPRFDPFEPSLCGVYDDAVALVEIACQDCHRTFLVAVEKREIDLIALVAKPIEFPTVEEIGDFHYGDPPNHGCTGDSMNVETIRIREFWLRAEPGGDRSHQVHGWERRPEYEIDYSGDLDGLEEEEAVGVGGDGE